MLPLKIPDKLTHAQLALLRSDKKYSDDQPRDEYGRWTDGGGTGTLLAPAREVVAEFDMQTALDEAMSPGEITDALKTGGFERTEIGDGPPVWVSEDGQQVVTWDQTSSYAELADVDRFIYDADVSEYYPDYDQQFSRDFWARPEVLYHATDEANIPSILTEGLEMRSETRGLTNRGEGPAVYTSTDPDEVEYYYGSVLEIDTAAMKADGVMPFVNQEPDIEEGQLREALASAIGYEGFEYEFSSDTSATTVVVNGPIPPQYIHLVDQKAAAARSKFSEDQPRDDHGRWTSGGGSLPPLTEAGPAANTARELLQVRQDEIASRDDYRAYQNRVGAAVTTVAQFAKNDNVREIGAAITEQAKSDPVLQAWLADPANALYRDAEWALGMEVSDPNDRTGERAWAMAVNGDFWGDDPAAEQWGIKMPSDPAEANALYWAAILQDTWAGSSSDDNVNSLALQSRANEIFGLGIDTTSLLGEDVTDNPLATGLDAERQRYYESHAPIMDAYLHAEYDKTQAMFKEAGITEMTLFRGMSWVDSNEAPNWAYERASSTEAQTNPLSSWSAVRDTAASFAFSSPDSLGIVLSAAVPVERIISTPFTGQGCLSESEFVVLGGTDEVTIQDP